MKRPDQRDDPLVQQAIQLLTEEYKTCEKFNEWFDGDEPIRVGNLEFAKSEVLFWLDRDGYYEQQEDWGDDVLHQLHEPCIKLLSDHGLQAPFSELVAAVERGRVVPFVGAGMSRPMGMPLWGDALRELLGRLPRADVAKIGALIDGGRFLDAAESMVAHDSVQVANFVRTKFRVQRMRVGGPMKLLPRIAKGCVVTTNFDDAIEMAFGDVKFDAYMHGLQKHNFFERLVRGERCLLKLHGDADSLNTHILTEAQYAHGYGRPFDFRKDLPKALRQVFVSQSLLFLGCSLEQDWTLDLFEQAKTVDEYAIPNHYAILAEPSDPQAKQQKESRLLTLNIQPLWYPSGQHEFVEKYLQFLVDAAEKRISYGG